MAAAAALNDQVSCYRHERRLLVLKNIPAEASRAEIVGLCRNQLDDPHSVVVFFWRPVVDPREQQQQRQPGEAMLGFPSRRLADRALLRLRGLSLHGHELVVVQASRPRRVRARGQVSHGDARNLLPPDEHPNRVASEALPPPTPDLPLPFLCPPITTLQIAEKMQPWIAAKALLFLTGIPPSVTKDALIAHELEPSPVSTGSPPCSLAPKGPRISTMAWASLYLRKAARDRAATSTVGCGA